MVTTRNLGPILSKKPNVIRSFGIDDSDCARFPLEALVVEAQAK
jgi:hypothetical protein